MEASMSIFAITLPGIMKDIWFCKKDAIGYHKRKYDWV